MIRERQQLLTSLLCDPSCERERSSPWRDDHLRVFLTPGVPNNLPPVARRRRSVNNQASHCSLPRRLFEFISPTTGVRESAPLEHIRILRLGFVREDNHKLAFHIHALVVVPFLLFAHDPVPHEHSLGLKIEV